MFWIISLTFVVFPSNVGFAYLEFEVQFRDNLRIYRSRYLLVLQYFVGSICCNKMQWSVILYALTSAVSFLFFLIALIH